MDEIASVVTVQETGKQINWKRWFRITLGLLIISLGLLGYMYYFGFQQAGNIASRQQITDTPTVSSPQSMNLRVELFRTEIIDDKVVSIFQVKNLNPDMSPDEVVYWTDNIGSCKTTVQPFSEFINVPTEGSVFSFFKFKNKNGESSQIYAASHMPIFQCGSLAE